MCRYGLQDEEEELQEFTLAERMTFLEFLPATASSIRKSFSSPELTILNEPGSETESLCQKSERPTCRRQESAESTTCSFGLERSRQVSPSACWTSNEAGESVDFDGDKPDFAVDQIQSNGSDPGSAGQWSVGAAQHAQGDCKPCAWFWRPGGCTRGEACQHCHLCPRGALQDKKRQNRQRLRAARAKAKAVVGT